MNKKIVSSVVAVMLLTAVAVASVVALFIWHESTNEGYCVTYEVTSDTFEGIFYRSGGRSFEAIYYIGQGNEIPKDRVDVENILRIGNYWVVVIEGLEPNTEYQIATFVESFAFTTLEEN